VSSRGVNDVNSATVTAYYGGKFAEEQTKNEFLTYLQLK
jgi:GTP cyclohydrolase I